MKILILRFSSIGDIVLCSPVIRAVKLQLDAEVHFVCKDKYKSVVDHNVYIDQLHLFREEIKEIKKDLKEENFDYVIDLHNNIRTYQVKKWIGKPSGVLNKINFKKWLYVRFKINQLPKLHIVDRYFLAAQKVVNIQNDGEGLDFFVGAQVRKSFVKQFPKVLEKSYVVLNLGATYFTKQIPLELAKKIIKEIEQDVYLIGGKDVLAQGEELSKDFQNVKNFCGHISIQESALIIEGSKWIITGDTGMMHIASALKKKIICIWGNTVPEFGMYPYGTEYKNYEVQNLSCRPCSKLGYKECPKGHFRCMLNQDVENVTRGFNEF